MFRGPDIPPTPKQHRPPSLFLFDHLLLKTQHAMVVINQARTDLDSYLPAGSFVVLEGIMLLPGKMGESSMDLPEVDPAYYNTDLNSKVCLVTPS